MQYFPRNLVLINGGVLPRSKIILRVHILNKKNLALVLYGICMSHYELVCQTIKAAEQTNYECNAKIWTRKKDSDQHGAEHF